MKMALSSSTLNTSQIINPQFQSINPRNNSNFSPKTHLLNPQNNPKTSQKITKIPQQSHPINCIRKSATLVMTSESSDQIVKMNNLLFVEMGVGYDQHGQDITSAAMRACRDAISSNSIPAFRRGSIPGVSFEQMKLQIKLGVPHSLQQNLDIEKVKSVFPYGKILDVEVVDGGLICSSGVHVEEMGDKNDDCYIVNAAVYVGY
ncbi:hypothetical protein RND81_07G150400 [Saponaria officinalis]|uniref:50S ribosomal protein L34, chloroplastic n=1 Tax=Saponaria officinalis TaxID=3572 RepID=A0AAW1JUR9_SAPOF